MIQECIAKSIDHSFNDRQQCHNNLRSSNEDLNKDWPHSRINMSHKTNKRVVNRPSHDTNMKGTMLNNILILKLTCGYFGLGLFACWLCTNLSKYTFLYMQILMQSLNSPCVCFTREIKQSYFQKTILQDKLDPLNALKNMFFLYSTGCNWMSSLVNLNYIALSHTVKFTH